MSSRHNGLCLCLVFAVQFSLSESIVACPVEVQEIIAPNQVAVNSIQNPDPYEIEIVATGSNLEYKLMICDGFGEPGGYCPVDTPYQASPEFSVQVFDPAVYTIFAVARSTDCPLLVGQATRLIFFYEPAEITPPDAVATLELSDAGTFKATWPSNPVNSTVARYRLILTPQQSVMHDPIVDYVEVPDPENEPPEYEFTYSFLDAEFSSLLDAISERIALGNQPTSTSTVSLVVEAISIGEDEFPYLPMGAPLALSEHLPSVLFSLEVDNETRTVKAVIDAFSFPGNVGYMADAVRVYYQDFGTDPEDYDEYDAPFEGMAITILDDAGDAIPSGAVTGKVMMSVVDIIQAQPLVGFVSIEDADDLDIPQCWDGVDNDLDGFTDFDGGDPNCYAQYYPFEYSNSNDMDVESRTLVVYNENTLEAAEIAEYYVDARQFNPFVDRVCPVSLPPGQFATADQLLTASDQIRECICTNILGKPENECVDISGESLAADSPITFLVLIKGIPPRLMGTGWPTDNEEPSFDYYLAWSIYHDEELFATGANGDVEHGPYDGTEPDGDDYQPASSINSYIRQVDPALDLLLAYGRIEAINTERTKELIDRTIAAERSGITGSFLVQGGDDEFDFLATLSSTKDDPQGQYVCDPVHYLADPDLDWPHQDCRTGTTASGLIPGEQILGPGDEGKVQSIPYAANAGIYIGQGVPPPQDPGHDGFSGFINMINWTKSHPDDLPAPCEPLCADIIDLAKRMECYASSTDFFGQINTDCVGVAPGFVGFQLRSWPVQYYGFSPSGWHVSNANGAGEKTMPYPLPGSPFGSTYLHFGALDAAVAPMCPDPEGQFNIPCPELVAVSMRTTAILAPPWSFLQDKTVRLQFRYRRGGGNSGTLKFTTLFRKQGGEDLLVEHSFNIAQPTVGWQVAFADVVVPKEHSPVDRVIVKLTATRSNDIRGYLDLDLIEVFDAEGAIPINFIPSDIASFERPHTGPTVPGDWAANAIDRLGGVGWWGSSSHHLTGGFAFVTSDKFLGSFYAGRTLGESLLYTGGNAKSGIVYGDPLYRPSGAKIYLNEGILPLNDPNTGFVFYGDDPGSWQGRRLYINAFHGQANMDPGNEDASHWHFSKCFEADVATCDAQDAWIEVESNEDFYNVNGVFGWPLLVGSQGIGEVIDLIDPERADEDQDIILRLRVWIPSQEEDAPGTETHNNDLMNFGYLKYRAGGGSGTP